jgi:hypothetical protein
MMFVWIVCCHDGGDAGDAVAVAVFANSMQEDFFLPPNLHRANRVQLYYYYSTAAASHPDVPRLTPLQTHYRFYRVHKTRQYIVSTISNQGGLSPKLLFGLERPCAPGCPVVHSRIEYHHGLPYPYGITPARGEE